MIGIVSVAAATLVITHANVLTENGRAPHARCIAIDGERIVAVGQKESECARRGAKIFDAHEATVVPGFNDAHVHIGLSMLMDENAKIPALPRARWLDAVRAAATRHPFGDWVVLQSPELPEHVATARDLDFIDHPLLVITRRGALFNSAGRRAAQLLHEVPQGFVPGRSVALALAAVTRALPAGLVGAAVQRFLGWARCAGLTTVQLISDEMPSLFEQIRERGALTLRVRFVPLGFRFGASLVQPAWQGPAPLWVRVDGVKFYHDDPGPLSRRELGTIVAFAMSHHLRVVFHVLGRYSLRRLLEAIETGTLAQPESARLFRLDHVDEATQEDARRIAKLGMVVCANPALIAEWHSEHYGPLRTLLEAGVRLCLGTDWIGESLARPLAPLENLALAVTHGGHGTQERISAAQALEAYTLGSAYGEGLERDKGSIEAGKLADLVFLSGDPSVTPVEQIPKLQVVGTMVGGQFVYRSDGGERRTGNKEPETGNRK